jgi:hypothetical protein
VVTDPLVTDPVVTDPVVTDPLAAPVTDPLAAPLAAPVTDPLAAPLAAPVTDPLAPIDTAPIQESAPVVEESTPIETAPVEPTPVLSQPALVEQVGDIVDALKDLMDGLLSGAAGQDIVDQVDDLVDALKDLVYGLLGGAAGQDMPEQVSGLVAKLKELVDGLLGGLLDGGETPNPGNMPTSPAILENLATALMRLLDVLHHSFFGQASDSSFGQVSNLPEQINSALVDIPPPISFSAFSAEGIPTPTEQTPTEQNQMPVHQTPVPSSTPPVSSYLAGSGTLVGGDAPVLLLGALASLAILMLGGRFSWPSYAILKPLSAIQLAIERPG